MEKETGKVEVEVRFNGEKLVVTGFDSYRPSNDAEYASLFKDLAQMLESEPVPDLELF